MDDVTFPGEGHTPEEGAEGQSICFPPSDPAFKDCTFFLVAERLDEYDGEERLETTVYGLHAETLEAAHAVLQELTEADVIDQHTSPVYLLSLTGQVHVIKEPARAEPL